MTDDCVFCGIIRDEIPSRTVYSDDHVRAFLDVNPLARGHTLVVPTAHHQTISDLPADEGSALFATLFRLIPAIEAAVDADASSIGFNNGEAAGQEIPHVHGHVIPRFPTDGGGTLHTMMGGPTGMADETLDEVADRIRARL